MSPRRSRSHFVARGDGKPYTPRHWNGQVAPTYQAPRGGLVPAAIATLILGGTLAAIVIAGLAVCMVLAWPVY